MLAEAVAAVDRPNTSGIHVIISGNAIGERDDDEERDDERKRPAEHIADA